MNLVCLNSCLFDHARQELGSRRCIASIRQVCRRDSQRVVADEVAWCTEDLGLRLGVPGDLGLVLRVARVPKEDDAGHLALGLGREALDGIVHDRRALAVPADEERRVGAHGAGHVDDLGGGGDGGVVCVLGHEVGREERRVAVLRAHALAGDLVGAELFLQTGASRRAWDFTLQSKRCKSAW